MMHQKHTIFIIFSASIMLFSACQQDQSTTEIQLSNSHKVVLLDSIQATKAILKDETEGYFERIQPLDMMLQMQKTYAPTVGRDSVLADYKRFLQGDVAAFTTDEAAFVAKVMQEAFERTNLVSSALFPEKIELIKTKGKHYGDDTYYTRDHKIIIPANALKAKKHDEFLQVMLHEISHILTRQKPNLKAKLYATIGFKKLESPLVVPDSLKRRLLLNPDGLDLQWATDLTLDNDSTVFALPLIYLKSFEVDVKKPFFEQMGWNYYELVPYQNSTQATVVTRGPLQKSGLNTEGINDIFQKLYNTQYIIHPDEIIADNFAFVVLANKKPRLIAEFTPEGKALLERVKTVLKE